jgi:CheY-like chemotaxis protein
MAHKVLVVDDEESLVLLMQTNLEFGGFEVVTASDGVEALEQVAKEKPDLILLDVRMPRKNGWEVCEAVKGDATTRHIPIIFLSAFAMAEDIEKGIGLGAAMYLKKSTPPTEVLKSVQDVLARALESGR